ncbi:MAG: type II toxin-antitoxin system VapC family toxin [Pseudomonadota bacterium]
MKLLIDSSAWLEYLSDSPKAKGLERYFKPPHKVVLPSIVAYEVYKRIKAERGERSAVIVLAQMERISTSLLSIDQGLAVKAADVSIEHKLPMADAFIYATALSTGSTVLTLDAHFKGLKQVQFIAS